MGTKTKIPPAATVDEYIKRFPPKVRTTLQKLRRTIKKAAPGAEELISYQIAGYKYHGMLVYFAAWEKHISMYPAPRLHKAFKEKLAAYKGGKGTVQFPIDKPLPWGLISEIVRFRVKQNEALAALKNKKLTP